MSELPRSLHLEVVTPDHELVHEVVDAVELRAKQGYLGVLPGHAPLLTELGVGELRYKQGGKTAYLSIVHGYAEVLPDRVIVLAEVGERGGDIDLERARAALERARKRLGQPGVPGMDWDRAAAAYQRAALRLDVAGHGGSVADHE
jgi:F-type H+-transporting ATPase subunit epsilon